MIRVSPTLCIPSFKLGTKPPTNFLVAFPSNPVIFGRGQIPSSPEALRPFLQIRTIEVLPDSGCPDPSERLGYVGKFISTSLLMRFVSTHGSSSDGRTTISVEYWPVFPLARESRNSAPT